MRKRKYKSGSKWCFWRWSEPEAGYITRLHLVMTPWFAVCLHWFWKPDPEPHLHDHPVSFLSLVLRGWYSEERRVNGKHGWRLHSWWNFIRASYYDSHRIEYVKSGTLTLCFMSRKKRDWGFHTPAGWVYWRDYNKDKYDTNLRQAD